MQALTGTSVFRVVKSPDYVTISNYHLRDKRLTLAAKGLMSALLADEGDASWTVAELAEMSPEGRDAIRSALKKLEACGYIHRRQTHDAGGRFASTEYLIYEAPFEEDPPLTENPSTVKPSTEKPLTENPSTVASAPELVLNNGYEEAPEVSVPEKKRRNKEGIGKPPTNPPADGPKWKPERFAAFWAFYKDKTGRGESKQAAKRAWDKLKPDNELIATIGKALQRQLQTDEWRRGIGIPYASTYLNQRRWEDDIGPGRRADKPETSEPEGVTDWYEGVIA